MFEKMQKGEKIHDCIYTIATHKSSSLAYTDTLNGTVNHNLNNKQTRKSSIDIHGSKSCLQDLAIQALLFGAIQSVDKSDKYIAK